MINKKLSSEQRKALLLTIISVGLVPAIVLGIYLAYLSILFLNSIFSGPASPLLPTLPEGAVNGEWSRIAIEQGQITLFNTIEEMADATFNIVRGEIIDTTEARIDLGKGHTNHLYSVYQFRIAEAYKGNMDTGRVVNIIQVSRLESKRTFPADYPYGSVPIEYIRENLAIGDELILFLRTPWPPLTETRRFRSNNTFVFRRIQGAYRYTPIHIREGYENWVFESVNEHNNLVLTERVLEGIRRGAYARGD